jgi:hypothetical protein
MFFVLFLTCAIVHAQLSTHSQEFLANYAADTIEYAFEIHKYQDDTVVKLMETTTILQLLKRVDSDLVEKVCNWVDYNAGKWNTNEAVWAAAEIL